MIHDYPITPSPTLVQTWVDNWYGAKVKHEELIACIANQAANWGADAELEACCFWVAQESREAAKELKGHRRPNSLSIKERSLQHLDVMERDGHCLPEILDDLRLAIESLPE